MGQMRAPSLIKFGAQGPGIHLQRLDILAALSMERVQKIATSKCSQKAALVKRHALEIVMLRLNPSHVAVLTLVLILAV